MGGTNAKMNDHQLNELLLRTREEAVLPASFQRGVWQAIAARAAQREARWGWLDNLLGVLAKPLPAAAVWSLELTSPGNLTRTGWDRKALNAGDKISVDLNPLRNGNHGGALVAIRNLTTGKTFTTNLREMERPGRK